MFATAQRRLRRFHGRPEFLLSGVLPMDRARVPADVLAGATLAALAIPEVMGYTKIAGMPVITGLYTLVLPVLLFALFGSSRHLVVGADSATAAILSTALVAMGLTQATPDYVAAASLMALMCAGLLIIARVLRLGFIANFLSRSVLIGFLTGVGIQVAMGQVAGMFGVAEPSGGTIDKFLATLREIPGGTSYATLAISVGVLATIVILEHVAKRIPGALFAVLGAILLSYLLNLQAQGVSILGPVPGGLPSITLPTSAMTVSTVTTLLPAVISLVVVILAQSAATSRAYALRYGDSFDENVDLVGLGLANVGAGITGTFVVNGSPTKTEMVDSAGGRSQIAQLTTGVIVVAVLLFLTGPLSYLPNAVLSAVVFLIGLRLIDVKGMRDIYRLRPGEFLVAFITAAIVVIVGVEQGIIVAMLLSILEHVNHSYHSHDSLLVWDDSGSRRLVPLTSRSEMEPGLAVFSFGASLFYANASRFSEEVMQLIEDAKPPLQWLGVSCAAMTDVDYSGADALMKLDDEMKERKINMALCDVGPELNRLLKAYGLIDKMGTARVYDTVGDLSDAFEASQGGSGNHDAETRD